MELIIYDGAEETKKSKLKNWIEIENEIKAFAQKKNSHKIDFEVKGSARLEFEIKINKFQFE